MSEHVEPAADAEAAIQATAEKLRRLDSVHIDVRRAYSVLGPLIKDLPEMDIFLLSEQSVAAWKALMAHDAEQYMAYRAMVRQKCGRSIQDLLDARVGPPRPAGSSEALAGFTLADLWNGYEPPAYLVKDFLVPPGMTVLFGQSGHLKSQVAIELALAAASGTDFHGKRANRTGVLYVAGEGHAGIRKRLRAWSICRGLDSTSTQPAIYLTSQGANLMAAGDQLRATVAHAAEILGLPIGLIIVDTLAANFGPGDENKAADMSLVLASVRNAAPEAAALIVHHTGHTGERERGSYALIASADHRISAKYDEPAKVLTLKWEKAKDDELPESMCFTCKSVPIEWQDADGEELRSIVLERTDDAPAATHAREATSKPRGLGANQETVLKVLQRLQRLRHKAMLAEGRDESEGKVFLDALREAVVGEKRMDRNRYAEALEGLFRRTPSLIRVEGKYIFLEGDR